MAIEDKETRRTGRNRLDRWGPTSLPHAVFSKGRKTGDEGVLPREVGGPPGLEPTRYGDWEKNGRCIDF